MDAKVWRRPLCVVTAVFLAVSSCSPKPGHAGDLLDRWRAAECPASGPVTFAQLAGRVDELDRTLFREGMIAVKAPDVWGQNRMTKYRAEFETNMARELGNFKYMLNGAVRNTDVTVLTSATSVGAAFSGAAAAPSGTASRAAANTATLAAGTAKQAADTSRAVAAGAGTGNPGTTGPSVPFAGGDPSGLLTDIAARLDKLQDGVAKLPDQIASNIQLEPTLQLDEHARYLNHLHELRRINAGDDLTDLPGYGLYLVRMPVSLLPGPQVRKGKAAEVTVEASHALTPDLLANTFRDVVIMDTAYQVNGILNKALHDVVDPTRSVAAKGKIPGEGVTRTGLQEDAEAGGPRRKAPQPAAALPTGAGNTSGNTGAIGLSESLDLYGKELGVLVDAVRSDRLDWYAHDPSVFSWLVSELGSAHRFMREQVRNGSYARLFQGEWFHAFDVLIQQRNYAGLASARTRFLNDLIATRNDLPAGSAQAQIDHHKRAADVLVYALMIQSVIVDRQLRHDMDVICQRKGCAAGDLNALTFYDLFPSEEAKQAFNAYVACKWPIHVFSLDPVIEQQNLLDVYSLRSELQMALAVAVSSGQVNVNNATKFARQLDTDLLSVALNRTAVGFGAGESTFGWRFYPRVQSPPPQRNLARFAGLLANTGPGPDYIEKNRRIEPGLRECVALVVVPNFVPAIRFNTAANWFDTTGHHAAQKFSNRDYLGLSRTLQQARGALGRVCDAGLYRPGDLEALSRRLDQLEALLPTQGYQVNLPDEGDLSGSEIFSSNAAGLAPRLLSWYGEFPADGADSQVFLLGTGFSVVETEVTAGGVPAANVKLLSRNVMEVTIPANARPIPVNVPGPRKIVFDVHVATPNGISNHLLVQGTARAGDKGPRAVTTTVTSKTTNHGDTATTTTEITTTPPGIILPQGAILPMGTNLPPYTVFAPSGGPTAGGTVPAPPVAPAPPTPATPLTPVTPAPVVRPPAAAPMFAPPRIDEAPVVPVVPAIPEAPAIAPDSPAPPSVEVGPVPLSAPDSATSGGRPTADRPGSDDVGLKALSALLNRRGRTTPDVRPRATSAASPRSPGPARETPRTAR